MLKFSGFAHLTSCHEKEYPRPRRREISIRGKAIHAPDQEQQARHTKVLFKLLMVHGTHTLHASRANSRKREHLNAQTRTAVRNTSAARRQQRDVKMTVA